MKCQNDSLDTTAAIDIEINEATDLPQGRSLIILLAIILACLTGWWVSMVRGAGSLSLPYLRVDIAIVCFVCMLPLAILSSDWLFRVFSHHSPPLFKLVQIIFYTGAAGILIIALTNNHPNGTLSSYDAWESMILRPVLAFWLMLTLCLIEGQISGRGKCSDPTFKPGVLLWGLALITAVLVPSIYIQSRVDEIVTTVDESLGSGRLGDARHLTREVCVLAPWQKIGGLPAGDLARDLDRSCFEIERNLEYMQLESNESEEATYQRARLLTILGKRSAALRLLAPWKDQKTVSPLTCQLLGNIYQHQELWGESERWYRKSLNAWKRLTHSEQQQAGIVSAWKGIAFAERKRGNYEEAESAYLSALSLAPTADQHYLLAQFYEDTQQTSKAREHATQAMSLNADRYGKSGQKLITSLQQQHFGCLNVWQGSSR
ncbi:tetratricopeptide repeat protein [Gimesia algae]|uniref:Tetratricopeptide repeat protein n=1 Tax=Gimesia algae TaxID=2527971 RepID=A0A517VBL0_9PLAN|nr:tetratricopeptide repeat protein [Gimesia algae]QDT90376.1 Tetratricopeptide repeat protein [Gimesia algae]